MRDRFGDTVGYKAGVRPSSGAASPDCAGAILFPKASFHFCVAAPEDGRTPLPSGRRKVQSLAILQKLVSLTDASALADKFVGRGGVELE